MLFYNSTILCQKKSHFSKKSEVKILFYKKDFYIIAKISIILLNNNKYVIVFSF